MRDCYKKLDIPADKPLDACPVCRAPAELWRYSETDDAPTSTAATCSNGEAFGPQSGIANEGCLLYMPPNEFYRDTIRDAARFWNEYAKALSEQRRKRDWEAAQVVRAASPVPHLKEKRMNKRVVKRCEECGVDLSYQSHWLECSKGNFKRAALAERQVAAPGDLPVPHTYGAFRTTFYAKNGKPPTEQQVFDAGMRGGRDIQWPKPATPPPCPECHAPETGNCLPYTHTECRMEGSDE